MEHYKSARQQIQDRPKVGENPNPTPVEIPAGHQRPESLEDLMKRMVRTEIANFKEARSQDEPDDELPDMDTEDDPPELTGYTLMESEQGLVTMQDAAEHFMDQIINPPPEVTDPPEKPDISLPAEPAATEKNDQQRSVDNAAPV